jgi:4-hydroxybenzoyl-CoA reductase subunit alpha
MGLGYALSEELLTQDGFTLNTTFLDYKTPAAADMPTSDSVAVETYEPDGPFGAKEAGEGLVSPTAPAVCEAVYQATGFRCKDLPITPIKVLAALADEET